MTNEKFDRLLSTIRNEHVDDKIVAQASDRVWGGITGDSPSAGMDLHTLRAATIFRASSLPTSETGWPRPASYSLKIMCIPA